MKLTTTVGEILGIIDSVWETTDVKLSTISSKVLLKGVHKADGSWLYVFASDYSSQALGKLEVDLDESFTYVVDPDDLTKGIRTLHQETAVTITVDKKMSKIKAGPVQYKLALSTDTAGHITSLDKIKQLPESSKKVRPLSLLAGFKAALFAVSKDKTSYGSIRNMDVSARDGQVNFTASDRNCGAAIVVDAPLVKEPFNFSMSREQIHVFMRLLTMNPAGEIEVHTEGSGPMFFKFHDLLFGCGKDNQKLPDIKKLIDSFPIHSSGKVDVKIFKETLRRAALFTDSASFNHGISLNVTKDSLTVSTKSFEEKIAGTFTEEASVIVRKDYLLDCLGSCSGKEIELAFPDKGKALIIKDKVEDDVTLSASYILPGSN